MKPEDRAECLAHLVDGLASRCPADRQILAAARDRAALTELPLSFEEIDPDELSPPGRWLPFPDTDELRQQMHRNLAARLRADLALTDEQMSALAPRLEELERSKARGQKERRQIGVELRHALRGDASDGEIQEIQERFDPATVLHEAQLRERSKRGDSSLTVRHSAELRFFLSRFRQEMERRVREFRHPGRRSSRR